MGVWRERMRAHDAAAYVHVIVNEGQEAGASLPHTHAQLYALPFVPAAVARERERFTAYRDRTQGRNLLGDLVQEEVRRRERLVAVDARGRRDLPVRLARAVPRADRPARRGPAFRGRRAAGRGPAARRAGADWRPPWATFRRSTSGSAPRPATRARFCWRIDLLPRLAHPAGLEMGAGVQLCVLAPERATELAARRRSGVIPIAAIIAAATAAGFGVEHRLGDRADAVARRVVWLMLWVLGPPVVFLNIAALEVDGRGRRGHRLRLRGPRRDPGPGLRDRHLGAPAPAHGRRRADGRGRVRQHRLPGAAVQRGTFRTATTCRTPWPTTCWSRRSGSSPSASASAPRSGRSEIGRASAWARSSPATRCCGRALLGLPRPRGARA